MMINDIQKPLGPLMIGISGLTLLPDEIEMIQHPLVGGIILFTRNFENKLQVKQLIQSIRKIKPLIWIAVDQEGGRVQRFKGEGFESLPPLRIVGEAFDREASEGLKLAKAQAYQIALCLQEIGIDFSFAPVLDLDTGHSSVIQSRGFHENPESIRLLMLAYLEGLRAAGGFPAVAKHVPGHGSVVADTHLTRVVDPRPFHLIWEQDLYPFRAFAEIGGFGMMASHVVYSAVDALPAGYSKIWMRSILRERIGFKGIIFSDDLDMAAGHTTSEVNAAELALEAGCDMILICNQKSSMIKVIDGMKKK